MILVWGIAAEPPIANVLCELERMRAPVVLLDQHDVLKSALEVYVDPAGALTGVLETPDGSYALEDISAVYARPYETQLLASVVAAGVGSAAWQHALAFEDAMCAWLDAAPALVVNRIGPTSTNGSKPFQLERIRHIGFEVPETLITTDAVAAEAFWTENTDVIYKSISSTRSIVQSVCAAHRERLTNVATCPTQFQRHVRGTDYRVHVVGDELFACRIVSAATDYRYPGASEVEISAAAVPEVVAEECRRAAVFLDLHVAGIDLRCTPDDKWFCFEVNPSPAFTYFEQASGLPIGAAIARLLQRGA